MEEEAFQAFPEGKDHRERHSGQEEKEWGRARSLPQKRGHMNLSGAHSIWGCGKVPEGPWLHPETDKDA